MSRDLWGLSTTGHLHPRFGLLSWAMITKAQWSSKGIDWRTYTVCLELIRHKDGSVVRLSRISEVIVSKCSSLMLWNLQLYNNSFEWKNVTFSRPPPTFFSGDQDPNPQDLRLYIVERAINHWRKRLRACVKAKVRHFDTRILTHAWHTFWHTQHVRTPTTTSLPSPGHEDLS